MFNITPISRGSGLHQSNSLVDLTSSAYNDQYSLHLSKASYELPLIQDMDSTSPPVSPTESPLLTSSASSSTTTSPTTNTPPTSTLHSSIWSTTKLTTRQSLVPRLNTSTVPSTKPRRITIHDLLMTPINQTPSETVVLSQTGTSHCRTMRNSAKCHSRNISEPSSLVVDGDGDVLLCSPPPRTPKTAVWQGTTTSPILGQLVGVPVQNVSNERTQQQATTSSAVREDDAKATIASNTRSRSTLVIRPSRMAHRSRTGSIPRSSERSCQRERNPSLASRSHTRTSARKSVPNPPPRLSISDSRKAHLKNTILHLGIPLVPLVSVSTGLPHPEFPRSILQYHLLTHDQLDSLAHWYHQTIDNQHERFMYPAAIEKAWVWTDSRLQTVARETMASELMPDLATKRRRFGRFIGLRGCESPILPQTETDAEVEEDTETLAERMEREWQTALRKAEEEERLQEKIWRGRW